jgi:ComF family protein
MDIATAQNHLRRHHFWRHHLWRRVGRIGRAVLDALLPPQCLTCDTPVAEPGHFCAGCFTATHFITEPHCRRCGVPFAHALEGGVERICPQCRDMPPPWGQARAALRYDIHSRRVILPLKHGDRTELARALAPMMARAGAVLLAEADLLVPVPLHRRRLRARRYNQSALLAQQLHRLTELPVCVDALIRLRATPPLGTLSAEQRARAVDGVFALRPGRDSLIRGRRILLIDDVLTSGATAGACARVLLAAGAARVDVLTAARVPDPRSF